MKHIDSRADAQLRRKVQTNGVNAAMRQVCIDARLRQGKRDRLLALLRERLEVRRDARL